MVKGGRGRTPGARVEVHVVVAVVAESLPSLLAVIVRLGGNADRPHLLGDPLLNT